MLSLFFLLSVLIVLTYFPNIEDFAFKKIQAHSKVETTATKTLTTDEIRQLITKQYNLTDKYNKYTNAWLQKEIYDGVDMIFSNYSFMYDNPEYDSAKIKFSITKYNVNGKTVEFISKTEIIQVHSESGWEDI